MEILIVQMWWGAILILDMELLLFLLELEARTRLSLVFQTTEHTTTHCGVKDIRDMKDSLFIQLRVMMYGAWLSLYITKERRNLQFTYTANHL